MDNSNSEFIFRKLYDNENFFLISTMDELMICRLEPDKEDEKQQKTTKAAFKFVNSINKKNGNYFIPDLSTFSHCVYLNRVYIVSSITSVFMLDRSNAKVYEIRVPEEDTIELCKNHAYIFIDTKIVFTGGINKNGKINNLITSFDISTYKFANEKMRENNMIPRYRHGSASFFSFIYIIGGFTSMDREEVAETIQLIRYDNLLDHWIDIKIEGAQPGMLIDPQIRMIGKNFESQYLIAFSNYKYAKCWYLHLKSSTGTMIDLTNSGIPKDLQTMILIEENTDEQKIDKNLKIQAIQPDENEITYISSLSLVSYDFRLKLN